MPVTSFVAAGASAKSGCPPGKGTRGGGRVIYFWVQADGQIFLLFAYAKNERANVTPNEARRLRECAGL